MGRSRTCSLQVDDPSVSGVHATIVWTGGAWTIRDATSTNGTFVDGTRVDPGQAVLVDQGSEIRFGNASTWRLVANDPPGAYVIDLETNETRIIEGGVIALGDAETATCIVHDERTGSYWVETPTSRERVPTDHVVEDDGRRWELRPPESLSPTLSSGPQTHLGQLRAEFVVSSDEEHVAMTVASAAREWKLPTRAHHYTLVTLARHRIADQHRGAAPSEAGWVNSIDLRDELRIEDNLLYTHIFRARKELLTRGIEAAVNIVERRAGQLRIGIADLVVHPSP
ncbi:MAG: FHA domain-containing protein [Myxococcota bacterium]